MKEKFKNMAEIVRIPYKYAKAETILLSIVYLSFSLIPALKALCIAEFIKQITIFIKEKTSISSFLPSFIMVMLFAGFSWLVESIIKYLQNNMQAKLLKNFIPTITEKKAKLKYQYVENDKTWDLMERISKDTALKIANAIDNLLTFIMVVFSVLGLLIILGTKSFISSAIIVAVSVPLFMIAIKLGKNYYNADKEATKYERRHKYLNEILTSRETAEERALFDYTDECNERFKIQYKKGAKLINKADYTFGFASISSGAMIVAMSIIIFLILLNMLNKNLIEVGLCISLIISITDIIPMITWQLPSSISGLSRNTEYMGEMRQFFGLEEENEALCKPINSQFNFETLVFDNVSFKYPQTDKFILKNASFIIEKGKHYALVGINGSGKTTISKLITGLYDNYEGKILLNGKELKTYSPGELKAIISVVYQDFAKYAISLKDNILIGNVNITDENEKQQALTDALKALNLTEYVANLKDKENTILGKIKENGVDLSGGQWQKIAIARSLVNNSSIKILDEPTAALDPISESQIYEEFEKISYGNTTIFISHRLGSTKLADMIYVLDNGKVAESGSHEELLEKNELYAQMYNSQKSWYM